MTGRMLAQLVAGLCLLSPRGCGCVTVEGHESSSSKVRRPLPQGEDLAVDTNLLTFDSCTQRPAGAG